MRGEAPVELAVAVGGLLVDQEVRIVLGRAGSIERSAVDRVDPVHQGAPRGRSLETELGTEPGDFAAVGAVVDPVPDVPLVVAAVVGIVGMNLRQVPPRGAGAVLAVRAGRVELGD